MYGRWTTFEGSRAILTRPDGFGRLRVQLFERDTTDGLRAFVQSKKPADELKREVAERFFRGDLNWDMVPRLKQGLLDCDDLYRTVRRSVRLLALPSLSVLADTAQEISQARCKTWSTGRVVLIGDAAACPSPVRPAPPHAR